MYQRTPQASLRAERLAESARKQVAQCLQRMSRPKKFARQATALEAVATAAADAHPFADDGRRTFVLSDEFDVSRPGRRKFLRGTLRELWPEWRRAAAAGPSGAGGHLYELIPEGWPCRLYFDLEYALSAQPDPQDGEAAVELFKQTACAELRAQLGVETVPTDFLDLDSSSNVKFSRHLVLVHADAVFPDNAAVGRFVQHLSDKLFEGAFACGAPQSQAFQRMFPRDADGRPRLFVDLGVYTRNRQFRMYRQSKIGKVAVLRVAEAHRDSARALAERLAVELGGIPAWVAADAPPRGAWAADWMGDQCEFLLLVASMITAVFCGRGASAPRLLSVPASPGVASPGRPARPPGVTSPAAHVAATSPFPEVDAFLVRLLAAETGDAGVRFRSVRLEPAAAGGLRLVYMPAAPHRFCHNLRPPRHHRSNGVYYIVELDAPPSVPVAYQRCLDPDCRAGRFRGPLWPLPRECNPFDEADARTATPPSVPPSSVGSYYSAFESPMSDIGGLSGPAASPTLNRASVPSWPSDDPFEQESRSFDVLFASLELESLGGLV